MNIEGEIPTLPAFIIGKPVFSPSTFETQIPDLSSNFYVTASKTKI